jgi:hypothetical protein
MRAHIQGTVVRECVVQLDGSPASIKIVRSLDPGLDDSDGSTLAYDISRDRFTRAPSRDPQTAVQPPLSIGDAVTAAKNWLRDKPRQPETTDYMLQSTLLSRIAGRASDRWSYQINLLSGAGIVTVMVLLDGSIVEPRRIPKQP